MAFICVKESCEFEAEDQVQHVDDRLLDAAPDPVSLYTPLFLGLKKYQKISRNLEDIAFNLLQSHRP